MRTPIARGKDEMQQVASEPRRIARARSLPALAGTDTQLRIERRQDGQLWTRRGDETKPVWVRRLFPWSEPSRYVSLRDRDDEEVALVSDLLALDRDSREALEEAMAEEGFVLEIEGIDEVEDEIEIRMWKVRTKQGAVRFFQTMRDEWPREMDDGALLIRDVAGDLYRLADPGALDAASRKRVWAFVD